MPDNNLAFMISKLSVGEKKTAVNYILIIGSYASLGASKEMQNTTRNAIELHILRADLPIELISKTMAALRLSALRRPTHDVERH